MYNDIRIGGRWLRPLSSPTLLLVEADDDLGSVLL